MHVDDSACNLASINLMKFRRADGTFDTADFEHTVDIVLLAQEIVVGPSSYPTERDRRQRPRASASSGSATPTSARCLMSNGMPYDSDEGRAVAAAITALMTGRGYRKSAEVAAAIGPYDEYEKNREPHNNVMRMHRDAAYEIDGRVADERAARGGAAQPGTRPSSSATSTATATPRRRCSPPPGRSAS